MMNEQHEMQIEEDRYWIESEWTSECPCCAMTVYRIHSILSESMPYHDREEAEAECQRLNSEVR